MRWRGFAAFAAVLVSAASASGAPRTGEIVVEVYSGFASSAPALAPAPAHWVVDVSSLAPATTSPSDDEQRRLAQTLVAPYLARHPGVGLESAALHLFRRGGAPGETCSDPASGSSLAAGRALELLEQELANDAAAGHARVVLASTFDD